MDDNSSVNDKSLALWLLSGGLLFLLVVWLGSQWFLQRNPPNLVVSALSQQYKDLRNMQGSVSGSWLLTLNPAIQSVQGSLVWNSEVQQGVMRFIRLSNPAKGFRYHLWIYDSQGPSAEPISSTILMQGSGRNERYIALQASQPVKKPYKFELVLEPVTGDEKPQILMMVQP